MYVVSISSNPFYSIAPASYIRFYPIESYLELRLRTPQDGLSSLKLTYFGCSPSQCRHIPKAITARR